MPEWIFHNANVITLDPNFPEAGAVQVENGIIKSVLQKKKIETDNYTNAHFIDCGGKTLMPGFIDPHIHFAAYAASFLSLDLSDRGRVKSIPDIQLLIRNQAAKQSKGTWIHARGYNEFYIEEQRHPDRFDLDAATFEHPVKLTHRSGHAHVLNSEALKLVGITKNTPDPINGMIERDLSTGEPTGLLYEMGTYLSERIPMPNAPQMETAVKKADKKLRSLGITSIQDASAGNGPDQVRMIHSWIQKDLIRIRISMAIGFNAFETYGTAMFSETNSNDQIYLSGIKIILDETTGDLFPDQKRLDEMVFQIHRSGQQAIIHAIEEKAVASACSAIENALLKIPRNDHRHRIEHCSVCPPQLAKRLAAAGICVVTQPSFLYFNGERYAKTVPKQQIQHLYPFNSLLKSGIKVAFSSDCPIVPPDPFATIYSAVTRSCKNADPINTNEIIGVTQVFDMMTLNAAEVSGQESEKGSISPGKVADFIIVNQSPMETTPEEIKNIGVINTYIGGIPA